MTITLIAASLMTLWKMVLTINVGKYRIKSKTTLGDGGNPDLLRAIRAHGNFIEFTPMLLIILGLLEYSRANQTLLLALAIMIVVGRILHGLGLGYPGLFPKDVNRFRMIGTLLSVLALLVGGITGLLVAYRIV